MHGRVSVSLGGLEGDAMGGFQESCGRAMCTRFTGGFEKRRSFALRLTNTMPTRFREFSNTAYERGETMYHQPVQNELPLIIFVELVGDSTYLSSKMSGTFSAHMRHALKAHQLNALPQSCSDLLQMKLSALQFNNYFFHPHILSYISTLKY